MTDLPPPLRPLADALAQATRADLNRRRRRRQVAIGASILTPVVVAAALLGPAGGDHHAIGRAEAAQVLVQVADVLRPPARGDVILHQRSDDRWWYADGRLRARSQEERWGYRCQYRVRQISGSTADPAVGRGAQWASTEDELQIYDPRSARLLVTRRDPRELARCRRSEPQLGWWASLRDAGPFWDRNGARVERGSTLYGRPTWRVRPRDAGPRDFFEVDARRYVPVRSVRNDSDLRFPLWEYLPPTSANLRQIDLRHAFPKVPVIRVNLERWNARYTALTGSG